MRRVLVRSDRCIGCRSCEIACVRQHLESNDEPHSRPSAVPRVRVESGPLDQVSAVDDHHEKRAHDRLRKSSVILCQHCDEPECVGACTAGALVKDPDGTVRHLPDLCNGCLLCLEACPFGAIFQEAGKTIVKCDLCGGKETPCCVEACHVDALYQEDVQSDPE